MSGAGTVPSSPATLQFGNWIFTVTANLSISGAGNTVVAVPHGGNTTLQLNAGTTTTISTPFTFSSSTITGAGALSITGTATWSNSTMSGTGTTTIAHGASLTETNTAYSNLERPLTNDGTFVAIGAAGVVRFASTPPILTNNADGVIDLQGDGGGLIINGGGSLVNNGTLERTAGTGEAEVDIPITSSLANVQVATGTLTLEQGGSVSGAGTVPSGATLQFGNGIFTVTANLSISGAGNTVVAVPHGGNTTLQLNAGTTTTISTPFTFSSTITGAGALSITGTATWSNSTMSGTWDDDHRPRRLPHRDQHRQ